LNFKNSSKEHRWDCKFCSDEEGYSTKFLKQKKGTGWSNLFSHIQNVHKEYHEGEYNKYVYCSGKSEEYAFLDRAYGYEKPSIDFGG
jgi:hypothetical protein